MGQVNDFKKGQVIISFDPNFNPHDLYGGYWWSVTTNSVICGASNNQLIGVQRDPDYHSHTFQFASYTVRGVPYASLNSPSGPTKEDGTFGEVVHERAEWTDSAGTQYYGQTTQERMGGQAEFKTQESGDGSWNIDRHFCRIWHKMD